MNWAPIPFENSGSTSDGCCYSIISLNAIACTFASVFPTLWTHGRRTGSGHRASPPLFWMSRRIRVRFAA
ncbi:hypothetical protein BDZ89DRAFT_507791 [Hymenopellis radicata]|nr:hypothetical protein BDZ89DRAFT_507791 [Hymenopellis radicata]